MRRSAPVYVSGIVLDITNNQPVPNVHVSTVVDGRVVGTTTDQSGTYGIDVPDGALVEVSHVSYQGETFTAQADSEMEHFLVPAAYEIPEVEIFGELPKPADTGSGVGLFLFGLALLAIASKRPRRRTLNRRRR